MKSRFISALRAERHGTRWRLLVPLCYISATLRTTVTVPIGFFTDLESVPRWLPTAYAFLRESAPRAAVVHDWLYQTRSVPRARADAVLYEAARVEKADVIRSWLLWLGVRLGGWYPYRRNRQRRH